MRLAGIQRHSLTNGPGVRLVVYFQGCKFNCKGCHNADIQNFDGGKDYTVDKVLRMFKDSQTMKGITLSGGEPLEQHLSAYALLAEARWRNINTMLYTGMTMDQWLGYSHRRKFEDVLDYIKVGPYIEEQRNLAKPYCGSDNQKVYKISEGGVYSEVTTVWKLRYRKINSSKAIGRKVRSECATK